MIERIEATLSLEGTVTVCSKEVLSSLSKQAIMRWFEENHHGSFRFSFQNGTGKIGVFIENLPRVGPRLANKAYKQFEATLLAGKEISGKFSGTYYHGTTLERALLIKKQGMKQKKGMRNFSDSFYDGGMMRKSGVYMVEKKLRAMSYAVEGYYNRLANNTTWSPSKHKKVIQACVKNKYAVVVIEVPQDYEWNITVDRKEHTSKSYIINEVPKEWITGIIPFTTPYLKNKLKGYVMADWLKWIMDATP